MGERSLAGVAVLAAVGALALAWWFVWRIDDALVVYCAHDAVFAESILRDFERQTGHRVAIRFDTEATKSLGLTELIRRERANPRADVFWNNQALGTMQLARDGLLEPYRGVAWARMPSPWRDPDGRWVGFGARLRVWIVRSDRVADADAARRVFAETPTRAAIAKPRFGTTLTHFAARWHAHGGAATTAWFDDWRSRGGRIVAGNAVVRDVVASGACDVGWTDTDDASLALDAGAPVAMFPIAVDGRVVCMPNTVAIVRGTRRRAAAEALVDYLASAAVEVALAHGRARQIPLGPIGDASIPADVERLRAWCARGAVDLHALVDARRACLDWLGGGAGR